MHDKVGAWRLLAGLKPLVPRLAKLWADGAYTSKNWRAGARGTAAGSWRSSGAIRRRRASPSSRGGGWWNGRFAWLVRNRRLRIDYERKLQTSETLIEVAFIRLLLRRLAKSE